MTMRRQSRLLSMTFLGALVLSMVAVAVPAMAATSTDSWDYSSGRFDLIIGGEVEVAGVTHSDVAGSECTVELESNNGRSTHRGHNLKVYVNGGLVLTLEGIEDEPFQMNSGSAEFVSSGSDDVVVTLEATMDRVTSSNGTLTVTCTTPPGGSDGCTPGYWKQTQHFDSWEATGLAPADNYDATFGVASGNDWSLLDALEAKGGGENALARHATAALLNASNPDVSYEYSAAEVIALVQYAYDTGHFEAVKDLLAEQNELGCPLN